MIYEVTKEVAAALAAKGVPYPVRSGPERAPASVNETRIVFERDRRATDEIAAPMGPNVNPIRFAVRWQAVQIWVYAQSTIDGAAVYDHERIAEQLVDKLTIALTRVVRGRKNQLRIVSAHFLGVDELELLKLEAWQGVVYQVSCAITRSVDDTTWANAKAAEATMGGEHGVGLAVKLTTTGATTEGGALPSVKVDL